MSWQETDGRLAKEFIFKDFKAAFGFMIKVAKIAEEMNHHPNWSNAYNRIYIELCTHDEGKVTEKDHTLAERISDLFDQQATS